MPEDDTVRWENSLPLWFCMSVCACCYAGEPNPVRGAWPAVKDADIQAFKDGPVYGNPEGIRRVGAFEKELYGMSVRKDHPRILFTKEQLPILRDRCLKYNHRSWQKILWAAEADDVLATAFAYMITGDEKFLTKAKTAIKEISTKDWPAAKDFGAHESNCTYWRPVPQVPIMKMAAAFDMLYDSLNETERKFYTEYIAKQAELDHVAPQITGDVFHGDAYAYGASWCWPMIALAHHYEGAEKYYLNHFNCDWKWGDMARGYAYLADGTPWCGYHSSGDILWALYLKNATGKNFLDDSRWPYFTEGAMYQVLNCDYGLKREMFHYGQGHAPSLKYDGPALAMVHGRTCVTKNSYIYGLADSIVPEGRMKCGYFNWDDRVGTPLDSIAEAILDIVLRDASIKPLPPEKASWEELPRSWCFTGGQTVMMRSDWSADSACAILRAPPTYSVSSHGYYHVASFALYRKGALSPETGCWFNGSYSKSILAKNELLIGDRNPESWDSGGICNGTDGISNATSVVFQMNTGHAMLVHSPDCFRSKMEAYEACPEYTYAAVSAQYTYKVKPKEYSRSVCFIPDGSKGWFVTFDRVETDTPQEKTYLVHAVTKPEIDGKIIETQAPGHIETFDGNGFRFNNVWNTSSVTGRILLPKKVRAHRIGGGELGALPTALVKGKVAARSTKVFISTFSASTRTMSCCPLTATIGGEEKQVAVLYSREQGISMPEIEVTAENLIVTLDVNGKEKKSVSVKLTDYHSIESLLFALNTIVADEKNVPRPALDCIVTSGYDFLAGKSNYFFGAWYDGTGYLANHLAEAMGGPSGKGDWHELGDWRMEIVPAEKQTRDYFLVAMYMGDVGEESAPVELIENGDRVGCRIAGKELKAEVLFNRTGNLGGSVKIEKGGHRIEKELTGKLEKTVIKPNRTIYANNEIPPVSEGKKLEPVNNLQPSTLGLAKLEKGLGPYTDRDYAILEYPKQLDGAVLISTVNDERELVAGSPVRFSLKEKANVYIAYDIRAQRLPQWISEMGFYLTDAKFQVDMKKYGKAEYAVFASIMAPGEIKLGANHGAGYQGMPYFCQYFVVASDKGDLLPPGKGLSMGIVESIEPMSDQVAKAGIGSRIFTDREYVIKSLPEALKDGVLILTHNEDKNSDDMYLDFRATEEADIYLCVDGKSETLPNWVGAMGFKKTDMALDVDLGKYGEGKWSVYQLTTNKPEKISLVANHGAGYAGERDNSNYFVIVKGKK